MSLCHLLDPPGPPKDLAANDITKSSCTLTWKAPDKDGGSPVTGYQVEKLSGTRWIRATKKPVSGCSFEITDLIEGSDNEFRVCAENAAGVGKPSETTGKFVAKNPFDVPGRPDAPELKDVAAESVTLSYKPPASDGGSPVTGYKIEMKGKLETRWKEVAKGVKEMEYEVSGLQAGSEYEFRVTAENKAGFGQPSAPSKPAKYGWSIITFHSSSLLKGSCHRILTYSIQRYTIYNTSTSGVHLFYQCNTKPLPTLSRF